MSVVSDDRGRVAAQDGVSQDGTAQVLELLEESLAVDRRTVSGATVRVSTTTSLREQLVEETLTRESAEIERVAVGRVVERTPDIRHEGDVTIIPVMEEVLVLERRLVLKEEVRIRRVRTTETHRETVQLREQAALVSRIPAGEMAGRQEQQPVSLTKDIQP